MFRGHALPGRCEQCPCEEERLSVPLRTCRFPCWSEEPALCPPLLLLTMLHPEHLPEFSEPKCSQSSKVTLLSKFFNILTNVILFGSSQVELIGL